jgi:hypothetical protein
MATLAVILFTVSLIGLLIGLISPKTVIRWGNQKNRKQVLIVYGITMVISFLLIGAFSNVDQSKTSINQRGSKPTITFSKELIRIGDHSIPDSIERGFDFREYNGTALDQIDKTIEGYKPGDVISIPFKKDVEVEVYYNESIDEEHSEFKILPDSRESKNLQYVMQGKRRSYKVNADRAIAFLSPWLYTPYGDGGQIKLLFKYVTKEGQKGTKEWVFDVGKNPKVYGTE